MNPIVINGTVLCDNITGIPRYVYENVVRLDKLIEGTGLDVRIAYRDDGRPIHLPELKNIRLVPLKSIPYFYNLAVLPAYLRRTHAFYVGLASDMLLTRRSVVVLHDIRPLVMDTDKGFFRFKFWVHCLSTKWFAQRVFTVSDNQRHLISEKLGIPLDKIGITYNGWEHMKNVTPDESIFDKMPGVKKGEYFYALGSLAKHKNFKWIREVARRSPDKTFVVAGGKDLRAFGDDTEAKDTHNVFYPGYVSDAENAALMKHCKLFLHPAVFEGFGIPPLEALALGRRALAGRLGVRSVRLPPPRADRRLPRVPARRPHRHDRLGGACHRRAAQPRAQRVKGRRPAAGRHGAGAGGVRRQCGLLQHPQLHAVSARRLP